jgi:hypothetical protein
VFGGSQQEQIERLLTHLDASERATLKLLAAFGIWDRELFSQAVTHFATGYPATGAAELGPRPFGWCKSGGPTALIRE